MVQSNAPPQSYQLRILHLQINPPIWRRLHVRSDSSVATLHELLQIGVRLEQLSPPPFRDAWQGVQV
jgi:Plasmid pRiA4b ORF-3-like protein